jgi:hypothetical protein
MTYILYITAKGAGNIVDETASIEVMRTIQKVTSIYFRQLM